MRRPLRCHICKKATATERRRCWRCKKMACNDCIKSTEPRASGSGVVYLCVSCPGDGWFLGRVSEEAEGSAEWAHKESRRRRRVDQLAAKLGLEYPGDYALKHRGWGRTTTMLLLALATVEDGEQVIVAGHTIDYATQLARQLSSWARELGIQLHGQILPQRHEDLADWVAHSRLTNRGSIEVFSDHWTG